ncbi:MAG: nickel-responsive regulator [Omnitrophica WOR_2 bacterium SM23_29]|nr:MAG: nickel-responsive regulator [Omnitrophica WOR_2 bacterium SM23_29]
MASLVRFGVSLEKELLRKFDERLKEEKFANRSEAIRGLIREDLVKKEWQKDREVVGILTLVYNHHKRELVNRLIDIQHDYHGNVLSTQHIHLDEDNCLEIIVIKGKPEPTHELYRKLKSVKGVKHAEFSMATTGDKIP